MKTQKRPLSIKELIKKTQKINEKINSFNLKMEEVSELIKKRDSFIAKKN